MSETIGIIIEISSKATVIFSDEEERKIRYLTIREGHITKCIVLPQGRVVDDLGTRLKFQIDVQRKEDPENFFCLSWEKILEVRTIEDGRPFLRNYYLCQRCRRTTRFFLGGEPFCKHCKIDVPVEENRNLKMGELKCQK